MSNDGKVLVIRGYDLRAILWDLVNTSYILLLHVISVKRHRVLYGLDLYRNIGIELTMYI